MSIDVPFISVLVPVYHPNPSHLRECIESVRSQLFEDWELCLVADGPQPPEVEKVLRELTEGRIRSYFRPENGGIAAATQDALEMANGQFIALLDNDDLLPNRAFNRVRDVLLANTLVDMLYTDEDKIDQAGNRVDPFFKPAFSPERLRTQMYTGHLGVYRRDLVLDVGGFRPGFDGSQDHDLALRVSEKARQIAHIPEVLYHWRQTESSTALDAGAKDWAFDAGQRAVQSHVERTGFPALAVRNQKNPGVLDLLPQLSRIPRVSVCIPTGGGRKVAMGEEARLVDSAVRTLLEVSTYPDYEVVVVADRASTSDMMSDLEALDPTRVRCVRDSREFNFAAACNLGAVSATGEVLVFLNDDTRTIQADWIERLVMYVQRAEIGAVGAKLLYADDRIQHAGVWSRHGGPGHRYPGFRRDHPGHMGALFTAQNCMAVTAACLAVSRTNFEAVGGFSVTFPLNFNDVDLCLKLIRSGLRNVVDCGTEIVHLESATRDPAVKDWEYYQLRDRWNTFLTDDFWDNPNHTGHGVQEFPATSESLLQSWEAIDGNHREARIWHAPQALHSNRSLAKEALPATA